MAKIRRLALVAGLALGVSACAGGSALQPDRSIFSLDNNYQRQFYDMPIEVTFEQTVAVFKEAGYKLDVIDRATGQVSGRRGASGDRGSTTDKDLKFYALVLPRGGGSELGIKIVQVIRRGAFRASNAELIVNDRQMYEFAFRRIENAFTETVAEEEIQSELGSYNELPPAETFPVNR